MKYKALLVDADDTILDFKKTELEALLPVLNKYNIEANKENIDLYSKINLAYWKKLETKELTNEEVITLRWDEFFSHFNLKCNPKEVNDLYFDILKNGTYTVPNALEFLKEVNDIMDVYIITNGNPNVQYNRLDKSGVMKYVKKAFISMEIGYNKPDKRYFDYVLDSIGLKNKDCIVLGDSLSSDILGANNAQIDCVLFDRFNSFVDYKGERITNLLDFLKYVK